MKRASSNRPASVDAAFTLLELLIAAALTALLAGGALGISSRMLSSWTRDVGSSPARASARVILDRLTLDLQSALYRDDGKVWLAVSVLDSSGNSGLWQSAPREKPGGAGAGSLRLGDSKLADTRYGKAGAWLRFFTNVHPAGGEAQGPAAPTAVAYQIIRHAAGDNPAGAEKRYLLHRTLVRAEEADGRPGALEAGFDLMPGNGYGSYGTPSLGTNDGAQAGDPFQLTRPGDGGSVLGENVIDFGVRLHCWLPGGGLQRIFPVDENDLDHFAAGPASTRGGSERFPQVADVMVRILTDEGARQIAALESPSSQLGARPAAYATDAEWWWSLADANSDVFTRRILLFSPSP
ncbi:MAG TPA: hypothetical protein VG838_15875 [Opitutaceae bacterium]|nr:hypothetical protein [Opitutaceae bacterium]